jgi:hypothetical protein
VTGTVRFGDSAASRFQTTLPLVASASTSAVYAQVAQDATYFTGLAVINRNPQPASVTISIFNSSGIEVGSGQRTLGPFARFSELLSEIAPGMPATGSGYFKVTSDRPVFSFALLGTHPLSMLVAIPPQ